MAVIHTMTPEQLEDWTREQASPPKPKSRADLIRRVLFDGPKSCQEIADMLKWEKRRVHITVEYLVTQGYARRANGFEETPATYELIHRADENITL